MAKNEKLNEEAAMNNNLSQADLLMAADNRSTQAEYTQAPKSDEEKAFEMVKDEKLTGEAERQRLQKYVDLGDVF